MWWFEFKTEAILLQIIEPSKEVALQLLESGRQNFETRKLGMDMLRQLSLHHDYVMLLVQDGYYLEALRYARKNKVNLNMLVCNGKRKNGFWYRMDKKQL